MKPFVLPILLSVSGCAVTKKVYGPDGKPAYTINCSGTAMSWNLCLKKASDLCGAAGYRVLERSGEKGVMSIPNFQTGAINHVATANRIMMISCGK